MTAALQEFTARRKQRGILELFGKLEGPGLRLQARALAGLSLFIDTSV